MVHKNMSDLKAIIMLQLSYIGLSILTIETFGQSFRYTLYAIEASTTSYSNLTTQSTTSDTGNTTAVAAPTQTPKQSLHEPCRDGLCRNGGTCHQPQLPGVALPSCHCPLHFTGTFCEKGRLRNFCSSLTVFPNSLML